MSGAPGTNSSLGEEQLVENVPSALWFGHSYTNGGILDLIPCKTRAGHRSYNERKDSEETKMRCSPFVVFLLLVASAFGQGNAQAQSPAQSNSPQKPAPRILMWTPPEHNVPPFGSQIRKAVSEVRESCKNRSGKVGTYAGTGFIVAYHDPRLGADQSFHYLVTNRHVANCLDDDLQPMQVHSISIQGTDMKTGKTPVMFLNEHGNAPWHYPTDDSVDLAVTPVNFGPDFTPTVIPLEAFFSKADLEAQNIGEGAKIILSGYFVQLEGSAKLQPLIREGVLSMIPDTPLTTTLGKPGTIYLGDVHIFGGNSGSPVFISTYGVRPAGPVLDDEFHFLGVVSGYYYEDSDLKLQVATTVTGKQRANSGISMIVPADLLKDLILNNPELKRERDANFPAAQAKR
jgi:hypothetical protein